MTVAIILIAIGVIALLVKLNILTGSIWGYTWPAVLIIIGLSWLIGRIRHRHSFWWWCGPGIWGRGKEE